MSTVSFTISTVTWLWVCLICCGLLIHSPVVYWSAWVEFLMTARTWRQSISHFALPGVSDKLGKGGPRPSAALTTLCLALLSFLIQKQWWAASCGLAALKWPTQLSRHTLFSQHVLEKGIRKLKEKKKESRKCHAIPFSKKKKRKEKLWTRLNCIEVKKFKKIENRY